MIKRTSVAIGSNRLAGILAMPEAPQALVIYAHRSGSSRFSARNHRAADFLAQSGFATLLFDLLTEAEASDRGNLFDTSLLAARVVEAIDWVGADPGTVGLPLGIFGVSAGAPAAIIAASSRPAAVCAIVLRGGRPDLAGARLGDVRAPTLMIVGGKDRQLRDRNISAMKAMHCETSLTVVPGAGHLFEETGTLERALAAAAAWYDTHLSMRRPLSDRVTSARALASKVASRSPPDSVVPASPRGSGRGPIGWVNPVEGAIPI